MWDTLRGRTVNKLSGALWGNHKVASVLHVRDEGTEGVRGSFNREAVEGSAEGWGRRI